LHPAALRQERPATSREVTALVSHEAAIALAARVPVAEGEAVIVAPARGRRRVQVVTMVEADAWDRAEPASRRRR
jgi:hypothetical protein